MNTCILQYVFFQLLTQNTHYKAEICESWLTCVSAKPISTDFFSSFLSITFIPNSVVQ